MKTDGLDLFPPDPIADDEEHILYCARLGLLNNGILNALDVLKKGDLAGGIAILEETVDESDGMLSFWDINVKDFDEDYNRYLFG